MVVACNRVWIKRVKLSILLVVSDVRPALLQLVKILLTHVLTLSAAEEITQFLVSIIEFMTFALAGMQDLLDHSGDEG